MAIRNRFRNLQHCPIAQVISVLKPAPGWAAKTGLGTRIDAEWTERDRAALRTVPTQAPSLVEEISRPGVYVADPDT